jgi:hypothetical protein
LQSLPSRSLPFPWPGFDRTPAPAEGSVRTMPPSPAVVEPSLAHRLAPCSLPQAVASGGRLPYVVTHQHRNGLHRVR